MFLENRKIARKMLEYKLTNFIYFPPKKTTINKKKLMEYDITYNVFVLLLVITCNGSRKRKS